MKPLKQRAEKEIRIVEKCVEKYADKISQQNLECNEIKREIDLYKEDIQNNVDNVDRQRSCAKRIKACERDLERKGQTIEQFEKVRDVLENVYSLAQDLFAKELYRYLIYHIPQRKLPRLVRNGKKIDKVYKLASDLEDYFYWEMERISLVSDQAEKKNKDRKQKNKQVMDMIKENNGNAGDDLDAMIAAIVNEKRDETIKNAEDQITDNINRTSIKKKDNR